MKKAFNFYVKKSSKSLYMMAYKVQNCVCKLHVVKYIKGDMYYISKYNNKQTCSIQNLMSQHRYASAFVIASFLMNDFADGEGTSITQIESVVRNHFELRGKLLEVLKGVCS